MRKATEIKSIKVTCQLCGHFTTSYGTEQKSINRCLALLHEQCPNHANNFYAVSLVNNDESKAKEKVMLAKLEADKEAYYDKIMDEYIKSKRGASI